MISDDCSPPAKYERMREIAGGDERFVFSRSVRRRGFYGNFERALELLPRGLEFVSLADQDDRWHPDKLETLVASIGDANLVYSDQRIVDSAGGVLASTYWGSGPTTTTICPRS